MGRGAGQHHVRARVVLIGRLAVGQGAGTWMVIRVITRELRLASAGPRRTCCLVIAGVVASWAAACGDDPVEPVEMPNRAPLVTAGIPAATIAVGEILTVNLAGRFSDPDGDALSFQAETSDAAVATVSVSRGTATVTAVGAGMTTTMVTAADPGGLSVALSFAVTVPNRPPVVAAAIPAFAMAVGDSVTLNMTAHVSDPDGDALSFAVATSDAVVATVSVEGVRITFAAVGAGTATITVTAADPDGLSAGLSFAVTVAGPLPASVVVAPGPATPETVSDTFRLADGFVRPLARS